MKTSFKIFLFLLLLAPVLSFAQTKLAPQKGTPQKTSSNCFKEWYNLFRERGGKPVPDGTQEVIISIRNNTDGTSQCYMGKVEVAGGKMVLPLWVQKEDGSFDTFGRVSGKNLDPGFQHSLTQDELLAVSDGMSISFRTSDMEFGRLFFYKFLNDKPKALKAAPSPSALIKN